MRISENFKSIVLIRLVSNQTWYCRKYIKHKIAFQISFCDFFKFKFPFDILLVSGYEV